MTDSIQELKSWRHVCLAGFGLLLLLAIMSVISRPFEYGAQSSSPIFTVVALLMVATTLAFYALHHAIKIEKSTNRLLFLIVCIGLSLRAVGLFTTPILEIDYYRYLWDGKVVNEGVSPYAHSPTQLLNAKPNSDASYQKAVALSTSSESNFVILQRIHFPDYRTIYPPVSQFVFAATMKWFPHTASVRAHVIAIRAVMVAFDLLTMWLIYLLLKRLDFHQGWLIAYAWNPLVIKEISNSGHLDSIVAFFIIASIYLLTRWASLERPDRGTVLPMLSGIALGLGVGAKLFPVVLFPALLFTFARYRWSKALLFSFSFIATSAICLWPMYQAISNVQHVADRDGANIEVNVAASKEGLSGFLSQWRMNDVIFSGLYRNLKPPQADGIDAPWYVVSSETFRQQVNQWCQSKNFGGDNPAFLLARVLTLALFALFYAWQLVCIYRETGTGINFERLTWIVAVFLFLQPTVNPWYWIWIAPLACLSRNAGWLLVSGFLMLYYCRFWFNALEGTYRVAGTDYSGGGLFDHGLAWIEFACIVAVMVVFTIAKRKRQSIAVYN